MISGIPLLTRGPLALFFGGKEIIPQLSSSSVKSSNIPFYFLVILSLTLQILLAIYKKLKFRKEIQYEQQLKETVLSGVRNVYGQIIIFTGFLACCLDFAIHVFLAKKHQENKNEDNPTSNSANGSFIILVVLSLINFTPFLNPKLR